MTLEWSLDAVILITSIVISSILGIFILRINWKRYGILWIISGVVGNIICYIFVKIGFYSFPYLLPWEILPMPFTAILTTFPSYVLFGVRYSPKLWIYKIPFYWAIVHIGMLAETLVLLNTRLIKYNFKWDFWDSYTWWWLYLVLFDWIGGLIVPSSFRKPIDSESFRYGKWAWIIFHFIVIITIFLGGYYLGWTVTSQN